MSETSPHDQLIRYRLNRAEEAYQDALLLMVQDGIVASIVYTIVAFMLLRLYLLMIISHLQNIRVSVVSSTKTTSVVKLFQKTLVQFITNCLNTVSKQIIQTLQILMNYKFFLLLQK